MLTSEVIERLWVENNYDFNKCLGACMQAFVEASSPSGDEITKLKSKVIDFIKDKIPYSYYGIEKLNIDYETIKSLVKQMEEYRKSESVDAIPIFRTDYSTMHDFFHPFKTKLKRLMYSTERRSSKLPIDCFGVPINFRMNHVVLFNKDICSCDICGIQVDHVTIDYSKSDDVYRITPWAYEASGRKVRMTVDHKKARGLGGKDQLSNTVPMCEPCNNKKSTIESRIANHNRDVRKLKNATIYPFQCSFYY